MFTVNSDLSPSCGLHWFIPFTLELNNKIKSKAAFSGTVKVNFLTAPLLSLHKAPRTMPYSLSFPLPKTGLNSRLIIPQNVQVIKFCIENVIQVLRTANSQDIQLHQFLPSHTKRHNQILVQLLSA